MHGGVPLIQYEATRHLRYSLSSKEKCRLAATQVGLRLVATSPQEVPGGSNPSAYRDAFYADLAQSKRFSVLHAIRSLYPNLQHPRVAYPAFAIHELVAIAALHPYVVDFATVSEHTGIDKSLVNQYLTRKLTGQVAQEIEAKIKIFDLDYSNGKLDRMLVSEYYRQMGGQMPVPVMSVDLFGLYVAVLKHGGYYSLPFDAVHLESGASLSINPIYLRAIYRAMLLQYESFHAGIPENGPYIPPKPVEHQVVDLAKGRSFHTTSRSDPFPPEIYSSHPPLLPRTEQTQLLNASPLPSQNSIQFDFALDPMFYQQPPLGVLNPLTDNAALSWNSSIPAPSHSLDSKGPMFLNSQPKPYVWTLPASAPLSTSNNLLPPPYSGAANSNPNLELPQSSSLLLPQMNSTVQEEKLRRGLVHELQDQYFRTFGSGQAVTSNIESRSTNGCQKSNLSSIAPMPENQVYHLEQSASQCNPPKVTAYSTRQQGQQWIPSHASGLGQLQVTPHLTGEIAHLPQQWNLTQSQPQPTQSSRKQSIPVHQQQGQIASQQQRQMFIPEELSSKLANPHIPTSMQLDSQFNQHTIPYATPSFLQSHPIKLGMDSSNVESHAQSSSRIGKVTGSNLQPRHDQVLPVQASTSPGIEPIIQNANLSSSLAQLQRKMISASSNSAQRHRQRGRPHKRPQADPLPHIGQTPIVIPSASANQTLPLHNQLAIGDAVTDPNVTLTPSTSHAAGSIQIPSQGTETLEDKRTPLHIALAGDLEGVADLLNRGYGVDQFDEDGNTLLHAAAQNGCLVVVEHLLARNAAVDPKNEKGVTPICIAMAYGHELVVDLLLQCGADCSIVTKQGVTPLYFAIGRDRTGVVKVVLDAGTYPSMIVKPSEDLLALHLSAARGNLDLCKLLIDRGADVNAVDMWGRCALHFAAYGGHVLVALALVKNGCIPSVRTNRGSSASVIATSKGHIALGALLGNIEKVYSVG